MGFNCDELRPVARGGSPYDKANVDAAHACCNNWRKTKSVREVEHVRAAVLERFGGWSSPLDFVAKAKAVRSAPRGSATRAEKALRGPVETAEHTTTRWL